MRRVVVVKQTRNPGSAKVVRVSSKVSTGFRRMPRPARFGPRQNSAKAKIFAWLFYWQVQNNDKNWYSIRSLYLNTGINSNYLQQRLPLWVKWRYLKQRDKKYRLDRKGKEFVEKLLIFAPAQCKQYLAQSEEFRQVVDSMDPPASSYKSLHALTKAINKTLEEKR